MVENGGYVGNVLLPSGREGVMWAGILLSSRTFYLRRVVMEDV